MHPARIARYDDVVDDRDAEDASGRHELRRGRDVLLARGRVAARMIVPVLSRRDYVVDWSRSPARWARRLADGGT
jgi:hypothetical protein